MTDIDKRCLPLFKDLIYTGVCKGSHNMMSEVMMMMLMLGIKDLLSLSIELPGGPMSSRRVHHTVLSVINMT